MPIAVCQTRNTREIQICAILECIKFASRNYDSRGRPPLGESRAEGVGELTRDICNFDWDDEAAGRCRCDLQLHVAQRHTRCGTYGLRDGRCRFGFPHESIDKRTLSLHRRTT